MLHTKIQDNWPSGFGEVFEHGGYLGHVTCTIFTGLQVAFDEKVGKK